MKEKVGRDHPNLETSIIWLHSFWACCGMEWIQFIDSKVHLFPDFQAD